MSVWRWVGEGGLALVSSSYLAPYGQQGYHLPPSPPLTRQSEAAFTVCLFSPYYLPIHPFVTLGLSAEQVPSVRIMRLFPSLYPHWGVSLRQVERGSYELRPWPLEWSKVLCTCPGLLHQNRAEVGPPSILSEENPTTLKQGL